MRIVEVRENRQKFIPLLLIGDEEEAMVEKYINSCALFAAYEGDECIAVCAVGAYAGETPSGRAIEIKNIAVEPAFHRRGAGRALINFVMNKFGGRYAAIIAATGDSPLTVPFYESCGFKLWRTVKDYFVQNYSHPIFEGGVQLKDQLWFIRPLDGKINQDKVIRT